MWPNENDTPSLTPEQQTFAEASISLLTDLIALGEGKTIQELHPEMNEQEQCERMLGLMMLNNSL